MHKKENAVSGISDSPDNILNYYLSSGAYINMLIATDFINTKRFLKQRVKIS